MVVVVTVVVVGIVVVVVGTLVVVVVVVVEAVTGLITAGTCVVERYCDVSMGLFLNRGRLGRLLVLGRGGRAGKSGCPSRRDICC